MGGGVGLHALLDDNAFGRVNDFAIVESQPYTELPVTLVLNNDDLTPLSATSDITAPEVTVTEPDGEGYVTYTATYELEAHSLVGSITTAGEEPYLHLHINVCGHDLAVKGGHLNACRISATCELTIHCIDGRVGRKHDEETGLNLFQFEA